MTDLVRRGDPRAVARAITLVENESPEGAELVAQLHAHTGHAYLVGVTGPPGAGKSTLVDRLITHVRAGGLTVGVIAVDPTSPFTGGAILGDRVRMNAHASDEGVFIRSMATRGHLGGLARTTGDAAAILDAAGRDLVIIETVGVGQDEVEIVRTADISVVMLVPGAGDDVQAIKAGIMEIADIFVVNKADREGASRLAQTIAASLSLQTFAPDAWRPPILSTEATTGRGVPELWAAIETFRARPGAERIRRVHDRYASRLRDLLTRQLLQQVAQALPVGLYEQMLERIAARTIDPYAAAAEILRIVAGGRPGPEGAGTITS